MPEIVHPLVEAVASVRAALDQVRPVQPVFLGVEAKTLLVQELSAARAQLDELELRVLAACGDAAAQVGARDLAAWWHGVVPVDGRDARARIRLAGDIERWPQVAEALAAGVVSSEQARVITAALDRAAAWLTTDRRCEAEKLMIAEASHLDPARLRTLGRGLLAALGADDGAAADAALLATEEAAAETEARLTFHPGNDGSTRITATLPDAVAVRLRTCLEAFAQPRRMALAADGRRVPYPKLLADALRELLERLDQAALPTHGGDATTLFVTMTLDQLRADLGSAGIGLDGDSITAAQARRLACTAGIIPVVLGGASEILDVGRKSRLHTPVMRKALRLRDKRCRAEACDVPAAWCEAHHLDEWARGGGTSVQRGVLLCAHHHHRAHDPAFDRSHLPDGDIRFHRRT